MTRSPRSVRTALKTACALTLALVTASPVWAVFPEKPLKIVSGFAAGGGSDTIARIIADAVAPLIGQRVVVENVTGVNGVIGAERVARGQADGHTLFQCPMSTLAITPQLVGATLPLDPGVELLPVVNLALSSYGLVVAANSPFKSVSDIITAARARPGQLTFASPGQGSAQHLSGELLKRLAKLDMQHVPYRGAAPASIDLIAGRIDFMFGNLSDVARQVQAGQLRLIGQGDPTRAPAFPDLPRIADTVPGFEVTGWFGLCGPKAMPAEAVKAWDEAVRRALQDPALIKRLQDAGYTPLYEGPAPFASRLDSDRKRWKEVIQASKVSAQ